MSSEGWRKLFKDDWAGCKTHNLPFLVHEKTEKRGTISISGYQESAANWNWYDFQEKTSWAKNISRR